MRAFLAVLAVVWTLSLAGIAVELHQINGQLAWLNAPMRSLAALGKQVETSVQTETREQRIERRAREIREASDETAEVMRRVLTREPADKSSTVAPSRR